MNARQTHRGRPVVATHQAAADSSRIDEQPVWYGRSAVHGPRAVERMDGGPICDEANGFTANHQSTATDPATATDSPLNPLAASRTSRLNRVLIVTDAWHPQVNGVVRTYDRLRTELAALGCEPHLLTTEGFRTLPMPTYPEIRLALASPTRVHDAIMRARPHAIHVATEGPLGLLARSWCLRHNVPFTTSYHTRFPEYLSARLPLPTAVGYALERWFHNVAAATMVATPSLAAELREKGFPRIVGWTRGVDTDRFRPTGDRVFGDERIFLYVGRVAVEKNLDAFLSLDLPGRKVIVGDGPAREELAQRFPDAHFAGQREGEELAKAFASADVFVFPSLTDTFGIVLLEAMASGLPVAAFPVTGPQDVVAEGVSGILSNDLGDAARRAMTLDPAAARAHALTFSWQRCAELFLENLVRIPSADDGAVGSLPA